MRLPDVIIGGAPKCGTSSVSTWLADHPDACRSALKETFFFMDEEHPLRPRRSNFHDHGMGRYATHFDACPEERRIWFEATTHYLYQKTALDEFSRWRRPPHMIFLLREPAERVWSSFQFSRNTITTINPKASFPDYVTAALEDDHEQVYRLLGNSPSAYVLARDIRYSQYVDHLTPWVQRLGRDRVHILLFEDVVADPRAAMTELSRRIGLSPDFYRGYPFKAENRTVAVRLRPLHRLARRVARLLPSGSVPPVARSLYFRLQARRRGPGPTPTDCLAMERLGRYFQPYNDRLRSELGVRTDRWTTPHGPVSRPSNG